MPVFIQCSTSSATDLRDHFLFSGNFYLALLSTVFKASLGLASGCSLKYSPGWSLFLITAINKRGILESPSHLPKASFQVRDP